MAYSDNFPATRPVFMADFANGGKIDPRATFSRASTGTFFGTDKVLSSENLLPYSENSGLWSQSGLLSRTGSQTDPAGGSTGFTLRENSSAGFHRIYQNVTATGDLAFTVYAKQNSGTRYLTLTLSNANNDWVGATFDLAGGAAATSSGSSSSYSSLSATQAASGSSYYKCTIKATGSITGVVASLSDSTSAPSGTYGLPSYTGDGSSSIDVSFSSLSTTGATDYSFTNGQIARSYQTKLQTAASGAARFEHSATDGQSAGILIESQSTNLFNYSEEFQNGYWTINDVTRFSNVAIAPNGELAADMIVADSTGSAGIHYLGKAFAFTSGNTYTFSVYVKGVNSTEFTLQGGNTSTYAAASQFNITGAGSISGTSAGSATIESVGNGWYRCSVTGDALATASTNTMFKLISGGSGTFDGDDYSGVLLWGAMLEEGVSHPSSYLKVEGSTATRAADSLSVTDASIFNGGEHSVYWEGSFNGSIIDPRMFSLSDGTNDNRLVVDYNDGNTPRIRGWADGTLHVSESATGQTLPAGSSKIVGTLKTNESRLAINGTQYASDTTGIVVGTMDRMAIGSEHSGGNVLNGHVKRVAYYSTALSQTEIETLTS